MSGIYNGTKTAFMDGGSGSSVYAAAEMPLDLSGDTLGLALANDTTAYTFSPTDGDYLGDILDDGTTATEFSGSGYTTAENLSGFTINENNSNNRAEWDANDYTFTSLDGETIQFALVAKQVGGDWTTYGDDPLVAQITSADFPLTTNGGDVTISWDSTGIVHIT